MFISLPRHTRNSGRSKGSEDEKGMRFGAEMLLQKYTTLLCNEVRRGLRFYGVM